ncbi:hypothetical protein BTH42_32680 [Burkholderia sp. SRS-W-2-2016]|uniref:hypothetical protein n=1 Tax=Burkholderia sp. SRS-W-2-2016 TaxID=1926878 RepID=UPI00094B3B59|nr:hypothetical protein [Burkholderia sp. SRS-W-2-2016]OLL27579.1 hypothetical protein BTH42_32680 [Burkholderia sp. SRS-W-2-2016]
MHAGRDEPTIAINGEILSETAAMTVRVALESFAAMLAEPDALGTADNAKDLVEFYKTQLAKIQLLIYD